MRNPTQLLFIGIAANTNAGYVAALSHGALGPLWPDALKNAGWADLAFTTWDDLTADKLQSARCVVLAHSPLRGEMTEKDRAIADLLVSYVEAGGGLLLTHYKDQMYTILDIPYYLAEKFGTQLLIESVHGDPARSWQIGVWWADRYSWTDAVAPLVSNRVRGVLFQSTTDMNTQPGVLPFLPRPPWQVTLDTGPNSHSEPWPVGLEQYDRRARKKGFEKNAPIAGVREFGRGRVGYIGIYVQPVLARKPTSDNDQQVIRAYLADGWQGQPSDLLQLYLNHFAWLAGRADQLAATKLALRAVPPPPELPSAWKMHRGVIGPRTTHSIGQSTPAEYVARAKKAGLDYLVFLEDFAALKPGAWEQLKADCARLTDATFVAVPGITYEDTEGNHGFVFGGYVKLPSQLLLDEDGRRLLPRVRGHTDWFTELHWLYGLQGFQNHSGWYWFSNNPYPPLDVRNCDSFAVLTQQGGRTVDRAFEAYALNTRNGQYLRPVALTLMRSADEIKFVERGVYAHDVLGAQGLQGVADWFTAKAYETRSGRHLYPDCPPSGMQGVSSGPLIELTMPRGDTDAGGDIYNPALQHWPLELKVTAPRGLREVLLMDGDRVIRRFRPRGAKTFAFQTILAKERQKYIWARATDGKGREALSRDIQCDSWLLRDFQCADRNNQLLNSVQRRTDGGEFYIGYGGDTAIPDKGPWVGRIRPVGSFVFDKKLGVGGITYDGSPEEHPWVLFAPYLLWSGQRPEKLGWSHQVVPGKEGGPHVQPRRVVSSSEVLIGDRILDGVFPLDKKPVIHVWHTLYPVLPSRHLKTTARTTYYLTKVDGVSMYLWEQDFELLRDLPVDPNGPFSVCLGPILHNTATEWEIVNTGNVTASGTAVAATPQAHPFNRGDYLGLYQTPFGSFAAYSLTDGLNLEAGGGEYTVGFKPTGKLLKRGTKLNARVLFVGMHREVKDPAALAKQILGQYGLHGAPMYTVEAQQGRVRAQEYTLDLTAGDQHCFAGTLRGLDQLAGNLGSELHGLNDNWSAIFQRGNHTRFIPVEDGIGYAVMRAEDEAHPVFIGHPVTASDKRIRLNLARGAEGSWLLELHNPTRRRLRTTVRSNPHATGFPINETILLSPGSSVFRTLTGSVACQ